MVRTQYYDLPISIARLKFGKIAQKSFVNYKSCDFKTKFLLSFVFRNPPTRKNSSQGPC